MQRLYRPHPVTSSRLVPFAVAAVVGAQLGPLVMAAEIADSFTDWSTAGTQGERGWFSGYYNRSNDGDGQYDAADFEPFRNTAGPGGGVIAPDGNHWTGAFWDLLSEGAAPWTTLGREHSHPNVNGGEHWTVRRWRSTREGPTTLRWSVRKTNPNGSGVTGRLFVNGDELQSATIAGGDTTGFTTSYFAYLRVGDLVDLVHDPLGVDGAVNEGSDGSATRLTIEDEVPPDAVNVAKIADSASDWSIRGAQGERHWHYGYYDQHDDVWYRDGIYSRDDFIPFSRDGSTEIGETNHWDGNTWNLATGEAATFGPWTQITRTASHPAANNSVAPDVHWAVRRWQSEHTGSAEIAGSYGNPSPNGDGTVFRIFHNDALLFDAATNGDAGTFDLRVDIQPGDTIDFTVDADGSRIYRPDVPTLIGFVDAGSDTTTLTATITLSAPFSLPNLYRRGDVDANSALELTDALQLLNFLFTLGPSPACLAAADVNADLEISIADAMHSILYLIHDAPPPPAPFEDCGALPANELGAASEACECR